MRSVKALLQFLVLLTASVAAGASFAQDAIPETPPELRDFRLDPERPQPQPQPRADPPVVIPPPAVSTVPQTRPEQPRAQAQRPRPELPPAPSEAVPVIADPEPETVAPETTGEVPEIIVPQAEAVIEPAATATSLVTIALGVGALALLLLGGYWLMRRRKPVVSDVAETAPVTEARPTKAAPPMPRAVAAKPPSPQKKPQILLDFIPEKATVSFTALSVKGQLRLVNEGDAVATGMELRAGLMSASAGQDRRIAEFHRASSGAKGEPLGDAKPGERIAMAIELSVPLTDMESFAVGDQKLLVPIMIANLSFKVDGEATQTIQLACMIGREASPPAAKMGPLRLDLGPRSFASLGQRPVNA